MPATAALARKALARPAGLPPVGEVREFDTGLVCVELAPTPSYVARCCWLKGDALTISTAAGRQAGNLVSTERYTLERQHTGRPDVVAFLLAKAGGEGEVYEVVGGANGRRCTCPAGHSGKPCKHLDAVAALVAAGRLPAPRRA